ncbi:amino acid adenylation domain-containing protein, partial [Anaerocolumna jejuensis]|uniref:amino acid adenylation domain-containing protein n=1 Tax=Anaerocolumna jejuensis TaxID=259063 RepID=UPI003F7C9323
MKYSEEIPQIVKSILKELLFVDSVNEEDSLIQLGCNSLKAIKLEVKLYESFGVEISLAFTFTNLTVFELCNIVKDSLYTEDYQIISNIFIAEKQEYYPASSAQKRMYALNKLYSNSTNYNVHKIWNINTSIDINKMETSFKTLLQRHEILRTSYEVRDGELVQIINGEIDFNIEKIPLDDEESKLIRQFIRPFNLSSCPLMRVGIIDKGNDSYILIIDIHHIAIDAFSFGYLINEFKNLYKGNRLIKQRLQYKDYTIWNLKKYTDGQMDKQKEYWKNRFSDEIPILNMPTDYSRPKIQSYEGKSLSFHIGCNVVKDIKQISKEENATMFMIFLAALNILISKHSNQEDVIIGTPITGRNNQDSYNIVGLFVNTLAIRCKPMAKKTFKQFLKEVKSILLDSFKNQDIPFEEIVDELLIIRGQNRNPLFDIMYTYNTIEEKDKDDILKKYVSQNAINSDAQFEISFDFFEKNEEVIFEINYCTKIYKLESIEILGQHFVKLIESLAKNKDIIISDINLLTEWEKGMLIKDSTIHGEVSKESEGVIDLFEKQAKLVPNSIAVKCGEKCISYDKLNKKANALARKLQELEIGTNDYVALDLESSIESFIGILAIMKIGATYIPIDNSTPLERKDYILNDCKPKSIIINQRLDISYDTLIPIINFKFLDLTLYADENLSRNHYANNDSYVIYTSGSTGKPKGVIVDNLNMLDYVLNFCSKFEIDMNSIILHQASLAFDTSVEEIFPALIKGGMVVIVPEDIKLDIDKLCSYIKQHNVNLISCSPLLLNEFNNKEELSSVKAFISGGDVLKKRYVSNLLSYAEVYNTYGPTEATVCCSYYRVPNNVDYDNIPIGKAINNKQIYVMNNENLCGIGIPGEICVTGSGITKGYLNQEELTEEKFTPNPFGEGKMYHTGDLARWLPDGNLEFLGRIDNQVKIRGYRIETGEIESCLQKSGLVKETVVLAKKDENQETYLIAYLVSGKNLNIEQLKQYMSQSLPYYMIPEQFAQIEEIPVTSNGKTDRRKLLSIQPNLGTGSVFEEPRNEKEEEMLAVWKKVLRKENISINDNLFSLGGQSLKAIHLISEISQVFGKEVSIEQVFKNATIKDLVKELQNSKGSQHRSIPKVEEKEYYETSSAQKRMYTLNQLSSDSTNYNVPEVKRIKGKLEVEKLEGAIRQLIKRYEILRTSYHIKGGKILQKVHEDVEFKLSNIKLNTCLDEEKKARIEKEIEKLIFPFDLEKGPMVHAGVIQVEQNECFLVFDVPHIATDGVSSGILSTDLWKLYKGENLENSKLQYKDYAEWQSKEVKIGKLKEQEKYWLNVLGDELPKLELTTDYTRPAIQSYKGANYRFEISKELSEELKKLGNNRGVTVYMVVLAAFSIVLGKQARQEDVIIGTPIAGRSHQELEYMVGMFVNTLAMRMYPASNKSFNEYLEEVKKTALEAYENQDYQFEELVEKLQLPRDTSRNPVFDVVYAHQDIQGDNTVSDLELYGYGTVGTNSKFDITLDSWERNNQLIFNFEYTTKLFKEESIHYLAKHFEQILREITKDSNKKLQEISMLDEEEQDMVIYQFNATKITYEKNRTIILEFEEQVHRNPKNTAIQDGEETITYEELNCKANQLANTLIIQGVKKNDYVAILCEKRIAMFIGMLGTLKAGAAYVPIDINYPEDRILYILQDSAPKVVLITEPRIASEINFKTINLNEIIEYAKDENPNVFVDPAALAYVIYTSGSTGNPKGVIVDNHNMLDYVMTFCSEFKIDMNSIILHQASLAFDTSVEEIFPALIKGGMVVILPEHIKLDIDKMCSYIMQYEVNLISCSPLLLNELNKKEKLSSVKVFISGGDVLKKKHISNLLSYAEVYNTYGPTEATVCCSYYKVPSNVDCDNLPIGKAISNKQIYVMNNENICGIGIPGEICVAGSGIVRGYLNQKELTQEKFTPNPFGEGRMYHTGDLARWLPDGNLEFLGRIDNQVKIRGYRIETGEIESCLQKSGFVK